jgi:3-oxoacyl-[acyl-carrier protein] reductase
MDTSLKTWDLTMKTNLTGTFITTREALRYMKKTGGKIINIASTAGTGPRPGWCAYAASKAGVINFSMSIAKELESYNIKVFCLCPAGTATDLRKKLVPDEDPTTIMQPEDVVNVVEYCLSDEADVIESQPIIIRVR